MCRPLTPFSQFPYYPIETPFTTCCWNILYITVAGERLDLSEIVIDSGATYTVLVEEIYNGLVEQYRTQWEDH